MSDCDFRDIVKDVEKLAAEFKSGVGGIVEIVLKELTGIFVRRQQVLPFPPSLLSLRPSVRPSAHGESGAGAQ